MTRTPDSNTEKLNELYKQIDTLQKRINSLSELNETEMRNEALNFAKERLAWAIAERDRLLDADL